MNSGGRDGITFGWHRLALPAVFCTSGVFSARAKAACLCSYCCCHHLRFYDRGRLGRVEIEHSRTR